MKYTVKTLTYDDTLEVFQIDVFDLQQFLMERVLNPKVRSVEVVK